MDINEGEHIRLNLKTGELLNLHNGKVYKASPFSEVQLTVYKRGGLLG
jgi:hypothetical protein